MSETDEQRTQRRRAFEDAEEALAEVAGPAHAIIRRDPHGQLTAMVAPIVWHDTYEREHEPDHA